MSFFVCVFVFVKFWNFFLTSYRRFLQCLLACLLAFVRVQRYFRAWRTTAWLPDASKCLEQRCLEQQLWPVFKALSRLFSGVIACLRACVLGLFFFGPPPRHGQLVLLFKQWRAFCVKSALLVFNTFARLHIWPLFMLVSLRSFWYTWDGSCGVFNRNTTDSSKTPKRAAKTAAEIALTAAKGSTQTAATYNSNNNSNKTNTNTSQSRKSGSTNSSKAAHEATKKSTINSSRSNTHSSKSNSKQQQLQKQQPTPQKQQQQPQTQQQKQHEQQQKQHKHQKKQHKQQQQQENQHTHSTRSKSRTNSSKRNTTAAKAAKVAATAEATAAATAAPKTPAKQ